LALLKGSERVWILRNVIPDSLSRNSTRYLTGRMSAHSVTDHEKLKILVDEVIIFVVIPVLTKIRGGPELQLHWQPLQLRSVCQNRYGNEYILPSGSASGPILCKNDTQTMSEDLDKACDKLSQDDTR
jgi:hypothetical protein